MKKILLSTIFAFAIVVVANAIVTQKVILKDGSVLYGYLQQQDGKGSLTICTDSALINVSEQKINNITPSTIAKENLPETWKVWAEAHDAYDVLNGKQTLALSKVVFKKDASVNQPTSAVKVLEEGAVVKYLELTPGVYDVKWKEVLNIEAEPRPKTALSGIDRAYKLKSGQTVKGQYAGETEETLKLYVDKIVKSFNVNDVVKYEYFPINPDQNIFEQSELLDVVKTRNGGKTSGVIVEQNYEGKTNAEHFFKIQTGPDKALTTEVKVADIVEVSKIENKEGYKPKFDILLNEGDVYVNRLQASPMNVKDIEKGSVLLIDSVYNDLRLQLGADGLLKVIVEYRVKGYDGVEIFKLIRLSDPKADKDSKKDKKKDSRKDSKKDKAKDSKKDKSKGKKKDSKKDSDIAVRSYTFSYKDIVEHDYRATSIETSVNHTTKVEYTVDRKGTFVLYDSKAKKAITFTVE